MATVAPPAWARKIADDCWIFSVYVQPGAKKNAVMGEMDGRLRLRIAAQAVDNKANKALTVFMANLLDVRPNRVSLQAGETSRIKTVRITDLPEPDWNAFGVSDVPS